eukprot:TRINITY_DN1587_c0_g1_i1.p1 TRINITY_DN1587_c0_g1~~TRINITY_DN1587_c0_g1_i1.p1  ORF type:complete len:115 (-),score=28.94 TRINITY_DN1587_c0_g1_i1:131-475(-)
MPFLAIQTNAPLSAEQRTALLSEGLKTTAGILGKPEQYMMVSFQATEMLFANSAEPTAFLDIRSIGQLTPANTKALAAALTEILVKYGVAGDRVFLNFTDVSASMWGHNGNTFA